MVCTAAQLGGSGFENRGPARLPQGGPGRRNFLVADEATLRQVATITGGNYFAATEAKACRVCSPTCPGRFSPPPATSS